jgi:endonuclease/exonuclease/phosphatase (EEP) superfamily protein YafD
VEARAHSALGVTTNPPLVESALIVRCRKLVRASVFALWIALGAALLGAQWWVLDLFAHFRVQYAALFLIAALVSLLLRKRGLAALCVVGAIVSAAPLISYLRQPTANAEAAAPSLRVVTFNVWFRNHDYERIARYLEETRADVLVLQELTLEQAAELHGKLPSYPHAQLGSGKTGAVVYARWPIIDADLPPLTPAGVRGTKVVLDWRGTRVAVLGVHLHWPLGRRNSHLRNRELATIGRIAAASGGVPLVVAGDLNITPWSKHFQRGLQGSGLADCAAGFGLAPSWPAQFPPLGIRIDHCFRSAHWRSVAVSTGPHLGSDHLPVVADLQLVQR